MTEEPIIFDTLSAAEHLHFAGMHITAAELLIESQCENLEEYNSLEERDNDPPEEIPGELNSQMDQEMAKDDLRLCNARQGIKFELYPPFSRTWEELTLDAQNEWAKIALDGAPYSEVACRFIAENTP